MTAAPQDDLEAIRSFIAADNPMRAASFVDELLERCESLADAPEAFRWWRATSGRGFAVGCIGTT